MKRYKEVRIQLTHLVFLMGYVLPALATQYFVSPKGIRLGSGSIDSPWDLKTAFNQPPMVAAGDTIWLRGGTYSGNFISQLKGVQGKYIYVIQYPEERAILMDERSTASGATLRINGAWTIYKGFEITNADTNRKSSGPNTFRPMGVEMYGPYTKLVNLHIHDVGHGVGCWKEAIHAEIYGCLIYHCGTSNSPGVYATHGHGIYSQNDMGLKSIQHNIVFNNFGFGIHIYPDPGHVQGYNLDGNCLFHNGILTNDSIRYNNIIVSPFLPYTSRDIFITNNCTYDNRLSSTYTALIETDLLLGTGSNRSGNLILENNYLIGPSRAGIAILNWDNVRFTHNTMFYGTNGTLGLVATPDIMLSSYQWNSNVYYASNYLAQFSYQYSQASNFDIWRLQTGFDLNSTFNISRPDSNKVILFPNQYDAGRAHVIVYNWKLNEKISVELEAAGLSHGQSYHILDAQNFNGEPVWRGVYNSNQSIISLQMKGMMPVAPIGLAPMKSTAPEFVVLVVMPIRKTNLLYPMNHIAYSIEVFPNPSKGMMTIQSTSDNVYLRGYELYNSLGQRVWIEAPKKNPANSKDILQFHQRLSGIYLLKVITNHGFVVKKLILQ